MTVSTPISKELDIDLTVRQELRTLTVVKNALVDARFHLGATRFHELTEMIENAILEASKQEIGASDYLKERE
jgi:hypothetical protein